MANKKVFRKEKMLARIEREGRMDMVDAETRAIMDRIDGCAMRPNLWRQTVHGENAYYCQAENGEQYPVNPVDCEDITE